MSKTLRNIWRGLWNATQVQMVVGRFITQEDADEILSEGQS